MNILLYYSFLLVVGKVRFRLTGVSAVEGKVESERFKRSVKPYIWKCHVAIMADYVEDRTCSTIILPYSIKHAVREV